MSVRILSQVWEKSAQEGGALLVMLALADFSDDQGVSWASVPRIAEKSRLTVRQVQRVLSALKQAGEIRIEQRGRANGSTTSNRYQIVLAGDDKMSSPVKKTPPDKMSPGVKMSGGDAHVTRAPDAGVTPPVTPMSPPDPSVDPSVDPSPHAPAEPAAVVAQRTASPVPKPRNPCFDALALACGSDPRQMTPRAARACGVALAEILKVAPEAKPDDFHVRAAKYHRLFRDAAISPNALAMHWAECGAVMPARQVDDDPEPEHWRQTIEEHYPDATILSDRRPWSILPKFVRQNVRECLTQIKRNQGQAA